MAAIFAAQVFGIDLSLSQQIMIMLSAVLTSIGTAGVPGSGLILLTVVLNAADLGCTLTSAYLIQDMKRDHLVFYTLPSSLMQRDFHFVTRKDAYVSRAVQAFCRLFSEQEP